ncbi:MAG: carbohydrate kinase family protein [Candidatus Hadarchaeia archaeon]
MKLDSVIVGHATVDVNVHPQGIVENILGGAPTYAGFAMTKLNKEVGIVSKIGKDFPDYFPPLFSKFGLNTEGILTTSGMTTKFENRYSEDDERNQIVQEVADSISPADIPEQYMNARSFYLSPVADEIPPETILKLSKTEGVTMLDPQGIFREIGDSGAIEIKKPSSLSEYFKEVDIVKMSSDEFRTFDKPGSEVLRDIVDMGPEIAILTLGEDGCRILFDEDITHVDGFDVDVKDLTGAGDVFGAAFLSEYLESKNPLKAARFANAAAALKIEYKGPTGFPSRDEVRELL